MGTSQLHQECVAPKREELTTFTKAEQEEFPRRANVLKMKRSSLAEKRAVHVEISAGPKAWM